MPRRAVPLLALAAVSLAFAAVALLRPAPAQADAYTEIQNAYAQAGTGTLAPCEFSSPQLEQALGQAPSYGYQYSSDVTDAIEAALAARADGACRSSTARRAASALGAGVHIRSAAARLPGSATAAGSGGLPLVLVLAFALAGGFLLALAGSLTLTALGLEPRWRRAVRHSLAEAEYRMSAGWEDLTDRLRR